MDTQELPEELPTESEFYLNIGLYKKYKISLSKKSLAYNIVFTKDTLDCYCIECKNDSVFKPVENRPKSGTGGNYSINSKYPSENDYISVGAWNVKQENVIYQKKFTCSRDSNHQLIFIILLNNGEFSKIGQFPSYADINKKEIERFKSILGKFHGEFVKAIGLFSHDASVGGFVYLRRIVENFIIKPAYENAKLKVGWDDSEYNNARVVDKIKLLKNELPNFIVSNSKIYSIFSKGIHELSEEECKAYFNVLKQGLIVSLNQIKEKKEKDQEEKKLKEEIDKISNTIK